MIIRKAVPEDFDKVKGLFMEIHVLHHGWRPDLFTQEDNPRPRTYFEKTLTDPSSIIYVAEDEDSIVGYAIAAAVHIPEGTPLITPRTYVRIEDICVESSHRSHGVGRALFAEVQAFAKEQGASSLELKVYSVNGDAIGFYGAMGMTPKSMELELKL